MPQSDVFALNFDASVVMIAVKGGSAVLSYGPVSHVSCLLRRAERVLLLSGLVVAHMGWIAPSALAQMDRPPLESIAWDLNPPPTHPYKTGDSWDDAPQSAMVSDAVIDCAIPVTRPVGGEVWLAGTTQTIIWEGTNLTGSASIVLYEDGLYRTTVGRDSSLASGTFSWEICPRIGDASTYTIGVRPSGCSLYDVLLGQPFEIVGSGSRPVVTVTSPLSSDTLIAGTTVLITWDVTGAVGTDLDVTLRVEHNGQFVDGPGRISMSAGRIEWDICPGIGDGADYQIKVDWFVCGEYTVVYSEPFSITGTTLHPALTITSPSLSDAIVAGTTHAITWDSTDAVGDLSVFIERDGRTARYLGAVPMGLGGMDWQICPNLGDGSVYQVRLQSRKCDGRVDVRSAEFSIVGSTPPPSVTLVSDLGGTTVRAGRLQTITWDAVEPVGLVSVYLTRIGNIVAILGGASVADERLEVPIPSTIGNGSDYAIRLRGGRCASGFVDETGAPFTITDSAPKPSLSLTSPVGGETLVAGTSHQVTWKAVEPSGAVTVWLYRDGQYVLSLGSAPMSAGSVMWDVCPSIGDSTGYMVRLLPPGLENVTGGVFEITGSIPTPTVTVLSPASGDTLVAGTSHTITWQADNPMGDVWVYVTRDISPSAAPWGSAFTVAVLGPVPMSDGAVTWNICSGIGDSDPYKIVVASAGCGQFWEGERFHVTGSGAEPVVTITRPVGAEVFAAGTTQRIMWNTSDSSGDISILLTRDGLGYSAIGSAQKSDGLFDWVVDEGIETGSSYQIQLHPQQCAPSTFVRSAYFTIEGDVAGDVNGDRLVDLSDHNVFAGCMAGPNGGISVPCPTSNFNHDSHVDLRDAAGLQRGFTGVP